MKLCITLCLLFSISANAGFLNYLQNRYYRNDYLLESRNQYDFKSCEEHVVEEEEYYYLICEDSILIAQDNMDGFMNDLEAIELKVTENHFLSGLKEDVIKQLSENREQMILLKSCLSNGSGGAECIRAKDNILEMLKRDLPRMRILMAQKSFPGVIYSPTKPQRFRNDIHHSISDVTPTPLTNDEVSYLIGHTDSLEEAFIQDVYRENEVSGLSECVEEIGDGLQLKSESRCERFETITHYRASLKFNEQNEVYENSYNDLIETNPLLTLLTVSGQESDELIFADIVKALDKLISDSVNAISNVVSLEGKDRVELLGYRQAVDRMLGAEAGGPSRIRCDVAQKLYDKNESSEMMTDIYIGLGAVAGGGLCAFTGVGLFGCSLGVGVAAEGVALAVAQRRHEKSQSAFFSGVGSVERTENNEFNRNLSLYLLPLAVASEGAMHAVKLVRRVPAGSSSSHIEEASSVPVGRVNSPSDSPVPNERRFNFEGRQEIDQINRELGLARKKELLDTYNPANKFELNRMDETYFSGLADILDYRVRQDFPDLSDDLVKSRVGRELDNLMQSCKGN